MASNSPPLANVAIRFCHSEESATKNLNLQIDQAFVESTPADRLLLAVQATLNREKRPAGQITLVITGDETVRQLNRAYAGIDVPTDVLSFAAWEEAAGRPAGFVSAPEVAPYLGDIIISHPTAARQAEAAGQPIAAELSLLAVHGALHLLGYDHATPEEKAEMWAIQDAILASLDDDIP